MATVRRGKNIEYRSREYLTADEMQQLMTAAGNRGRHRLRDRTLLLLMYRHGLRASETASLRWDAVLMDDGLIDITRVKGSKSGVHPLKLDELEALAELKMLASGQYLFPSERSPHITPYGIASLLKRCGELAGLPFKVHPHMLRHACGYYLANKGFDTRLIQEWLGHRDIKNTERYTALNVERFKEIQW